MKIYSVCCTIKNIVRGSDISSCSECTTWSKMLVVILVQIMKKEHWHWQHLKGLGHIVVTCGSISYLSTPSSHTSNPQKHSWLSVDQHFQVFGSYLAKYGLWDSTDHLLHIHKNTGVSKNADWERFFIRAIAGGSQGPVWEALVTDMHMQDNTQSHSSSS